jgi:hypothetical protein
LLPESVTLEGYYVGSFGKAQVRSSEASFIRGYVVENGEPHEDMDWLRWGLELLECFFTTPEPSLLRYEITNSGVSPVSDESTPPQSSLQIVDQLQKGAFSFCVDYWRSCDKTVVLSREGAISGLRRLLVDPSEEEAIILGNLEHAEGFGDQYHWKSIARPPSLIQGISKPHLLRKDFRSASWRPGYVKRLNQGQKLLFRIFTPNNYRRWMA